MLRSIGPTFALCGSNTPNPFTSDLRRVNLSGVRCLDVVAADHRALTLIRSLKYTPSSGLEVSLSSQDSSGRFAEVKGHLVAYHENKSQSAFTQFHQAYLEPTLKSKIGRLPAQMADDQDDFDQNVCIYFLKNASALDAQGFAFWNQIKKVSEDCF